MNAPWNNEDLRRAFDADFDALVAFASRSKARVGFAFLRADGQVDLGRPLDARISARMTHVFALAQMRGIEGAAHLVSHGLAALTGPLRAPNGSWYAEVVPTSENSATPVPRAIFSQRAQSAMIGAATAAVMVGHDEARDLLADLEADQDQRWWDPCAGAVREEIEAATGTRSPLRRLSTNLDTAQAYLAAWEATGSASGSTARAQSCASSAKSRRAAASPCPTSTTRNGAPARLGRPDPRRAHPPRRYPPRPRIQSRPPHRTDLRHPHPHGRTTRPLDDRHRDRALRPRPRRRVDGRRRGRHRLHPRPHRRCRLPQRMHWVVCEAASAARVLAEVVDPSRAEDLAVDYARAVAWADSHARAGMGRWIHEVAPDGSVSMLVWEGRPDALTAARMLARGAAPIHLTVTGATAARSASQPAPSASS